LVHGQISEHSDDSVDRASHVFRSGGILGPIPSTDALHRHSDPDHPDNLATRIAAEKPTIDAVIMKAALKSVFDFLADAAAGGGGCLLQHLVQLSPDSEGPILGKTLAGMSRRAPPFFPLHSGAPPLFEFLHVKPRAKT
jgi:hypothetical protein